MFDMGYPIVIEWDIPRKGEPMKMAKDSEAKKRWDKENTVMVSIKFQNKPDGDIIDFLRDNVDDNTSKQDIIKAALREYIANRKETDSDIEPPPWLEEEENEL